MMELRKVTESNMDEIITLDVAENQKMYKEVSILRLIANAYACSTNGEPTTAYGIYADDAPIGFCIYMYTLFSDDLFKNKPFNNKKSYFVYYFMIDEGYQGRGYGKLAFDKMLEDIKTMPNGESEHAVLFYKMSNVTAKKIYASSGFIDAVQDNDIVYAYKNIKD